MFLANLLNTVAATITIDGSTTTISDGEALAAVGAGVGAVFGVFMIFCLAIAILAIVAMWKIFTKCGEAGWKSIIPIYNMVVLCQIAGYNPLWILAMLIPVAGWVFELLILIGINVRIAKGFGKSTGFAIGMILLSFIFDLILAFDKSTWDPSKRDMTLFSFMNDKNAPAAAAPAAGNAKGTPEDPWVEGK